MVAAAPEILLSLGAGLVMGIVFFGGLWLTVRRLGNTGASLVLLSLVLRLAVIAAGFYALAHIGDWRHVAAGAAGMILVRVVISRQIADLADKEKSRP